MNGLAVLFLILFLITLVLMIIFMVLFFSKRDKKVITMQETNKETFYYMTIPYLQDLIYAIGLQGCYAMSLVFVASDFLGKELDLLKSIYIGIKNGVILYNENNVKDNDNMYVKDAEKFLKLLTGKNWRVTKQSKGYNIPNNCYAIHQFSYNNLTHFEPVGITLIKNSNTRSLGVLAGYRICECLGDISKEVRA